MDDAKVRKRVQWMVIHAFPLLLLNLAIVVGGAFYKVESTTTCLSYFFLGVLMTRLLLLLAHTGTSKQQMLVTILAYVICNVIMSPVHHMPAERTYLTCLCVGAGYGVYNMACYLSAVCLLFVLFRQPFLNFIGTNTRETA